MGRNRIVKEHQSSAFSTADVHNPASNNAAVVTYAAFPGAVGTAAVGNQPIPAGYPVPAQVSHVITGFRASVLATAILTTATPHVTITDDGNVVFDQYLDLEPTLGSSDAVYSLDIKFPFPKKGTAGKAMVITVSNPGSGNTAKLFIYDHFSEIA